MRRRRQRRWGRRLVRPALALVLAWLLLGCDEEQAPAADAGPEPQAVVDAGLSAPWAGRDDLISAPEPQPPRALELPPLTRSSLDNGLELRLMPDGRWPIVHLHLVIRAGTDREPRRKRALAAFAAEMLTKGTAGRSADAIAGAIDYVGGELHARVDRDGTHLTCQVLSRDLDTCLELLADMAARPVFPANEMGVVRDQLIAAVKQVRDNDSMLACEHFQNLLWTEAHIRGWPATVESVNTIERDDLVAWHRAHFMPNNALLAVTGDLEPARLRKRIGSVFGGWQPRTPAVHRPDPPPQHESRRIRLVDKPGQSQAHLKLGHLGLAHADPDFAAAELVNHILAGATFSSRLMKVVRAEGGKVYGVKSEVEAGRRPGAFWIWTFTRNAEALATLELVLAEIERMHRAGPTAGELADAKSHLAGRAVRELETVADLAAALVRVELHGLPADHLRQRPVRLARVELEQARRVARERLHPDRLAVVLVGDGDAIAPQLDRAGLAYERVGYLEPTTASGRATGAETAEPVAGPRSDERGRELLQRALEAKGVADRPDALRRVFVRGSGSLRTGGRSIPIELRAWEREPDARRQEIAMPLGTAVSLLNARGVWLGVTGLLQRAPPELAERERAGRWRDPDRILLHRLRGEKVRVRALDPEAGQGRGRRQPRIELSRADGSWPTVIQLDPDSMLIERLEYDRGEEGVVVELDDYRPVAGIQIAHHIRENRPDGRIEIRIESIELDPDLGSVRFAPPSAAEGGGDGPDRPAGGD